MYQCPSKIADEATKTNPAGFHDREILPDHCHVPLVEISEWLNELPAACRNVATHEVALLNSHLRNAGQQTAVLRNGASVPDDEYSAEIWWFRTWADTDPACMIRLEWK